jgi:acetyltransferase
MGQLARNDVRAPLGEIAIRPLGPSDVRAYDRFCSRLAPIDVHMRFGRVIRCDDDHFRRQLLEIDHETQEAFIALDATGEIVGVGRIAITAETEIAVITRSDLKRRGIARALLLHIADYARARGRRDLLGYIQEENFAMRRLAETAGCSLRWQPEVGAIEARFRL